MTDFEILEHTADVGLRARGRSLEELFGNASRALASILGAWAPGEGEEVRASIHGRDVEGLLVEWLNEVLYLHDARDAMIAGVSIEQVAEGTAQGRVTLSPRRESLEGTSVKAVTYHQLKVARSEDGTWTGEVYLDV